MRVSVLIIDDEPLFRSMAEHALLAEGFDVRSVGTLEATRHALAEATPDILVMDRRLPDGDGIAFLRQLHESGNGIAAVVVTAYGDVDNAVEALRSGAADYLTKPLQVTDLVVKLRKVLETRHLRDRLALAKSHNDALPIVEPVSAVKRALLSKLRSVATSPLTPVLLTGASGVGKQFAAERLHAMTYPESDAPFVEVNCASLPEDMVERELFGAERGVLSDSPAARRGLIEMAHGGTLFLDEITDTPLRVQGKLLKFLDNLRFRRLGSERELSVRLRVVAATHENIAEMVAKGTFREDLFHRLSVFLVDIPTLASGQEDIEPLARAFVNHFATRQKKRITGLADSALQSLSTYTYPGNVRELRNIIERAVILARGPLIAADDVVLPEHATVHRVREAFFSVGLDTGAMPLPLEHVERQYVARVLMHFKGHRTAAAEALGISYPTFLKRLRELGFVEEAQQQHQHQGQS